MSTETEYKILQLCQGMTLKQADYRLALMKRYIATKQLGTRLKVTRLNIGD